MSAEPLAATAARGPLRLAPFARRPSSTAAARSEGARLPGAGKPVRANVPAREPPHASAAIAAVVLVAAATLLHFWMGDPSTGHMPFAGFYAATAAAAVMVGPTAALYALGMGLIVVCGVFPGEADGARWTMEAALFAGVGLTMAAAAQSADLSGGGRADLERRHATLGAVVPDGYGIGAALRGADGRLLDLRMLESNAELSRMLGLDEGPAGGRLGQASALRGVEWLLKAEAALGGGGAEVLDVFVAPDRRLTLTLTRCGSEEVLLLVRDHSQADRWRQAEDERFAELNHRVKNSLTAVAGILRLQAAGAGQTDARVQLLKAADRVHAIASVHECLYRSGRNESVELGAYAAALCEGLSSSLLEDGRIRIETQSTPVMTNLDEAVPLGFIINELVTNAVKHAYPAPIPGVIRVAVQAVGDEVIVTVADSGCGSPDTARLFDTGGLGMTLVRSLVGQIRGELRISAASPGLVFEVRAPLSARSPNASLQGNLF